MEFVVALEGFVVPPRDVLTAKGFHLDRAERALSPLAARVHRVVDVHVRLDPVLACRAPAALELVGHVRAGLAAQAA